MGHLFIAVVLGLLSATSNTLAPVPKGKLPKPLPEDLIAAWAKVTAYPCWTEVQSFRNFPQHDAKAKPEPSWIPTLRIERYRDGMLDHVPAPDVPFGLILTYTHISETEIAKIARFENLVFLNLSYATLGDKGMQSLRPLKNLQALDISLTKVTAKGLEELEHFPELQSFRTDTGTDRAGLQAIARCPRLRYLELGSNTPSDALEELLPLKELVHLDLEKVEITEEGVASLAKLRTLRSIGLQRTPLSNGMLKVLTSLPNLEALYLDNTRIGDEGVRHLLNCPNLMHLEMRDTKVTANALNDLIKLTHLRHLRFNSTPEILKALPAFMKARPDCHVEGGLTLAPR